MSSSMIFLLLVIICICELIKYLINRSKGRSGAQYQELQNLVAAALPGESGYQVAYGYYEVSRFKSEYTTRIIQTTYYHFAIAFRSDCLWVAPLGFDKKTNQMSLTAPMVPVHPQELGLVTANANPKKTSLVLSLYSKDHSSVVRCGIYARNQRSSRFQRANIYQPEACEALCEQMCVWAERVNAENAELQAGWKLENTKQEKPRTSLVLGVVGLVLGLIAGPFGMLMGLIGLLKAHTATKDGALVPKGYRILNIVAVVAGLLNSCFWVSYFTRA